MTRILVIEDNGPVREATMRILSTAGYEVIGAADGASGLGLWRVHGADLILTDVHMGDPDGIALTLQLRMAVPSLPVVIMTGDAPSDADLLNEAGLRDTVGILAKPFLKADLLSSVESALRR